MKDSFAHSMSDFIEVHKNPLNESVSKNLWSLSKSGRFSKDSVYCDKIYDFDTFIKAKKGAGIGYGNKSDFTEDLTCSPPSTKYNSFSGFHQNKVKNKGFSISVGRQLTTPRGYIELQPLKFPGPGAYEARQAKGILYTMRKKLKAINKDETVESQNDNPGPGAYNNPEATQSKGSYFVSKFRNSGARYFNPNSSSRFSPVQSKVPGPGAYIHKQNNLSHQGRYPLSKHKGHGRRSFDLQARQSFVDDFSKIHLSPGPASYRPPSQFGYYNHKTPQIQKAQD